MKPNTLYNLHYYPLLFSICEDMLMVEIIYLGYPFKSQIVTANLLHFQFHGFVSIISVPSLPNPDF